MTLNEILNLRITDKQIENLENRCYDVLGDIEEMLDEYGAPMSVKEDFVRKCGVFKEKVKDYCAMDIGCFRADSIDRCITSAYVSALNDAICSAGLRDVHLENGYNGRVKLNDMEVVFRVDRDNDYALEIGIKITSDKGDDEPVDYFHSEDMFRFLYEEVLIDALYERSSALTNGKPLSKPEIRHKLNACEFGSDLYKFIVLNKFIPAGHSVIPKLDAMLASKDKQQEAER